MNIRYNKEKKGYGIIDTIIDKLPEIHIPSYQYAGPGTKLEERLARGDPGKNELDVACKDHDIAYAANKDSESRSKADKILIGRAFKRIYGKDAKLDERAAALLVSFLMAAKVGLTKIGLGLGTKKTQKKMKKHLNRKSVKKNLTKKKVSKGNVKKSIKKLKVKSQPLDRIIKASIQKPKNPKRSKTIKTVPRVLKVPKFGGNLQSILPILNRLSAAGPITASTIAVVKALKDIELIKKHLMKKNKIRKNACGSGLYLKPANRQHQ